MISKITILSVPCKDLKLRHGIVGKKNGSDGGVADFFCDTGTVLEGNRQRVCLPNGEWSCSLPTCMKHSEFIYLSLS